LDAVRYVSWEEAGDESDARIREADLIVMLQPAFNASHAEQSQDCYVVTTEGAARTRLAISAVRPADGHSYGTFPHLAPGAFSPVAKQTKDGYRAFARLYEAAGRSGSKAALHAFLAGRSARLLVELRAELPALDLAEFTRIALERDAGTARTFFELAPARLRRLRPRPSP